MKIINKIIFKIWCKWRIRFFGERQYKFVFFTFYYLGSFFINKNKIYVEDIFSNIISSSYGHITAEIDFILRARSKSKGKINILVWPTENAKILSNQFDNFIYVVGKKISSYRDIDLFIKDQSKNDKISYFFNKYDLYFDFLWLKLQHPYYYSNYYYDYYSGYGDRLTKYSDLLNSWKFLKGIFLKWLKSLKK